MLLASVDVQAIKDLPVLLVPWVLLVVPVFLDLLERLDLLDPLVKEENVVREDLLALLDHLACQVNQDHLVFKVHLARLANVVTKAPRVTEA